jgi:hypothetical protein
MLHQKNSLENKDEGMSLYLTKWVCVKSAALAWRSLQNICAASMQARRLRSSLMPAKFGAPCLNFLIFSTHKD